MHDHFKMFAAYNAWANQRLYEAAGKLDDGQWLRDCGAFFGSMQRTLNHLLVTDRIWLRRFTGEGPAHAGLDEVPFEALGELRDARQAEDRRIIAFVDSLSPELLAGPFTYVPVTNPVPVTQKRSLALAHLFNHQTHHRGQAHVILTSLGQAAPSLDLIYFQRSPEGAAWA